MTTTFTITSWMAVNSRSSRRDPLHVLRLVVVLVLISSRLFHGSSGSSCVSTISSQRCKYQPMSQFAVGDARWVSTVSLVP